MLVNQFLEQSARLFPDKKALIFQDERVTYAEFDRQANRLAHGLIAAGVQRGDRVIIWRRNSIEACVGIFGALKAGAAFVVLNPTTKKDKLINLVADCRAAAIVTDDRGYSQIASELAAELPDTRLVVIGDRPLDDPRAVSYSAIMAEQPDHQPNVRCIDRDLAALIYTSGSTGLPKGVMSAHYNMVAAARAITQYVQNTPDDIVILLLPLSFDYGLYQLIMTTLFGGTLVIENSFAFPVETLKLMRRERVTGFPGVPSVYALLLQLDEKHLDLPDLRYMTNTGAALPVAHIQRLRELFGSEVRIYSMYGQTECKRTLYLPPEEIERRPGSVGIPIPNEEVFLLDEDGHEVGPGEVGELYVRGANVMLGYWERPEATARTYLPGPLPGERILRTFDLFRRDDAGFLYFVSRTDDIVKSRGQKVSPKEIEEVIYGVNGVAEVAVIGVSHDLWGETLHAYAVREDGSAVDERAILRHCKEYLEDFMIPERVIFLDALPKNASGKIDRLALQQRYGE
ncbi:MAG: AMP-binding protein [Anaerolineae bacterium]|nr:AMP-binding protein [Anaerolineae bacterium]